MPQATRQQMREGRQRLIAWLREAQEHPDEGVLSPDSPLGKATFGHVTMENLDALLIYPAPKGGWHCDLLLKNVPPGVPNSFGTPVQSPLKTREEAEERGHMMLAAVLSYIAANKPNEKPEPVFMLHNYKFPLLPDVFEAALQIMPELREEGPYGSELRAVARIEEVLEELFPRGFDVDAFNAMDPDHKATLLSVLHGAALNGVFRYPPLKHGSN